MTRFLVTAGPTREPIDAVRYISNRSSGRMGIAIARAAEEAGHSVTLLLGPVELVPAEGSRGTTVRFQTAAELLSRLRDFWPLHDVLVMAAAVSDYRPRGAPGMAGTKLRRGDAPMTLELEPTPDLLLESAAFSRPDQTRIGFALEPAAELDASARGKLQRKRVDAIVANPLEAMDSECWSGYILAAGGRRFDPPDRGSPAPPGPDLGRLTLTKVEAARWIVDCAARLHASKAPGSYDAPRS